MKQSGAPSKDKRQNIIQRLLATVNTFQINHRALGFPYAVIRKYSDDNASYQGALITYYGFLSLFPLLIVATTVTNFVAQYNSHIRAQVVAAINSYFPIVGSQIQSNIHNSGRLSLALIGTLLITLYGAKGVADAMQFVLNQLWQVPKARQRSFPKAVLTSLTMIILGGVGILLAATLSSVATAVGGHGWAIRVLSIAVSLVVLFGAFTVIMSIGSLAKHSWHTNVPGAAVAAVGLQILETLGGYLITHELHNLQGAYGQFALVLAILFWLYLQAEVFLYAVEVNAVLALRLWPRSLVSSDLTDADKRAAKLYVQKDRIYGREQENVDATVR